MINLFGTLLGLLVLAYLFLSPFVLIILYRRQREKSLWLENELKLLKQTLQEYREQSAGGLKQAMTDEPARPVSPQALKEPEHKRIAESIASTGSEANEPEPVLAKETASVQESVEGPVEEPAIPSPEKAVQTFELGEKLPAFLRGMGMWPPSGEEGMDRETVLMQWWLPRGGGLLALLSALFFGVYINQNTSPLFKCLELIAASLAVSGLGLFMERKYKKFGSVLLVTGLIMLYMTSVAAYTLQATRVIENPVAGSIVQAIVLVGICLVGLFRQSKGLVLLTFHFGYFLGLFMVHEGLREGSLIEAGLLFVAGIFLIRKELFRQLAWVIISGSFIVVLAFPILSIFKTVDLPESVSTQIYIGLISAGVIAAYYLGLLGAGKTSRLLLPLGSSLAILSTGLFFRALYPAYLEWASLSLGIVMLAGALTGWSKRGCGFAVQLLFIKASFLISVWAILYFAGDLRWMVLALQTAVVAYSARRAGVIAMEILVGAVALVSLGYFLSALGGSHDQGTFVWWMMMLYPLLITLAFAYLMKPYENVPYEKDKLNRVWIYAFVPLLSIGLWSEIFNSTSQRNFDMALPFIGLIYVAGGLSLVPVFTRWMLLELAALAFVSGSIYFCDEPFSVLQLIGILVAAGISLNFITRITRKWAIVGESAIYLFSLVPVILWVLQVLNNWEGQAIVMFILCGLITLSGIAPMVRQPASWGFLPLLVFMLTEEPSAGAGFLNIIAYTVGFGWLLLPVIIPKVKHGMGWALEMDRWVLLGGLLFYLYVLMFGDPEATWMSGQWVLGILSILFLLACHKWKLHGYLMAALLFAGTLTFRHSLALGLDFSYVPWISEALMSAGLLYAFSLLWFFLRPNPFADLLEPKSQYMLSVNSAGSAILFFFISFVTFHYSELGWLNWYTPILAITAFIMILLGLFFRDTIYRQLGLLALLVPLVRLFLVDVQEALQRIIAFAASAVLLTVLGYLYHRLSSHLSNGEDR